MNRLNWYLAADRQPGQRIRHGLVTQLPPGFTCSLLVPVNDRNGNDDQDIGEHAGQSGQNGGFDDVDNLLRKLQQGENHPCQVTKLPVEHHQENQGYAQQGGQDAGTGGERHHLAKDLENLLR